ncbi:single-stranded DNA-binding protein [Micromonospora sp. C28SCA-DRY-2]|uniref:single-stranded DNA-binding protein n=1 Tax=Micromonospora sp. C28SCA-DRY-2 TaxID=3059522 RepID=UPI002675FEB1|nr:single-stranded DNA-binding protein [Micromonospora sp. C28SCA-DRY-2]MDO3702107.1 single-stranded DNA-binding protein [Micromonospora sp. C28SCA-DRY-2]
MFDTYVTIVGNVLTAPEWRRTTQSNTLVANFKVASTARRLDRDSGRWVDGNSLRVRVNCWRKLAEGVAASVMVGDPVVVCGRLYTRDWTDDAGNHRTLYELEAVAVGHDLSRGRGRFLRNRPSLTTSTVEDAEAEQRVHGEPTEPVPTGQAPVRPDDRPLDDDFELPGFAAPRSGRDLPADAAFAGPLDPFDERADDDDDGLGDGGSAADGPAADSVELTVEGLGGGTGGTGPLGADDGLAGDADELAPLGGAAETADGELGPAPQAPETAPGGRGRRGRGRVPQPA